MGHSQAEKARNRERILDAAAARIREDGPDAISIAGLMEAVGLTHGGFYNHFHSRAELLTEALKRALESGANTRRRAADGDGDGDGGEASFDAFVRDYLSASHRDHPESGCAIAALAAEVARGDEALRAPMTERVHQFIDRATEALGNRRQAMLAVSAMVGALTLSRVLTEPRAADELLRTVRDQIRSM